MVMDGRVDNWEELRRELLGKGAPLRNRADSELVLRAYEVWGRECLGHIDGDFALVIWDARRQEAFCARDRAGSRRFHYHWNGQTLVFATDVLAVLSMAWVPKTINDGMVVEHLANEWHSLDETFWQDVLRLVPAHRLVAGAGGLQIDRYWLPDMHATIPCRSDGEYIEYYRALFTDVVRRMSRSNHTVACDVSGGLDSSAIFAVAERLRQDGLLPAPGLEGYALDFRGDPDADELVYGRAVGTHLGRTIHEIAPARMPLDWFRDHARRYREPACISQRSDVTFYFESVSRAWVPGMVQRHGRRRVGWRHEGLLRGGVGGQEGAGASSHFTV
jgi:asparagine synthase (glutamine-hydrolysing)